MKGWKVWFFFLEFAAIVGILAFINFVFIPADPGMLRITPSPYWIPIIAIPSRYGFWAGLVTGVLTGWYICFFQLLDTAYLFEQPLTAVEIFLESADLGLPTSLLFAAIFLGGVRQQYIGKTNRLVGELVDTRAERDNFADKFHNSERASEALRMRVVGAAMTIETLFQTAERMGNLDEPSIIEGVMTTLRENFHVPRAALLALEGDELNVRSHYGWEGEVVFEDSWFEEVLKTKKPVWMRSFPLDEAEAGIQERPAAVLPIVVHKELYGVIVVFDIPYEFLTLSHLELLALVSEWVSHSLANYQSYASALDDTIHWIPTKSFSAVYCATIMPILARESKREGVSFGAAAIRIEGASNDELAIAAQLMRQHLREDARISACDVRDVMVAFMPGVTTDFLQSACQAIRSELGKGKVAFVEQTKEGNHRDMLNALAGELGLEKESLILERRWRDFFEKH